MKFQKLNIFGIFFQIFIFFFFKLVQNMDMNLKKKKKISVVAIVCKKLKKHFHQSWSTFHVKMLVQRHYVNFTCRKKTQKFSFFFHLLKNARKCQKTKTSKKKKNTFFFEKKIFFWFFLEFSFFHGKQTNWTKKLAQNAGNMCLRDINNFRGKIT